MRLRSVRRMRMATRVARLYCMHPDWQLQDIDRELELPPYTASHLLKYARTLGLLTVKEELPPRQSRDFQTGSRLGTLFPPTYMVVIDTPGPVSAAARARHAGPHGEDDLLHQTLGAAAAELLARKGLLRHHDIVGVGAGRAIFHAARALAALPGAHQKRSDITFMALHGRAVRRIWRESGPYALQSIDAVRVTHAFADAVPMSAARPLHLPLVQKDAQAVSRALEEEASFLSRKEWERKAPTLAFIGLGIMGAPQSFGALPGEPRVPPSAYRGATPIARPLRALRTICQRFREKHGYIPVSDVCDRLFWVPGPDDSPELRQSAGPLIAEVNGRLLTVETGLPDPALSARNDARPSRAGSLDQVQEIVLVAGGPHKERAICRLLRHRRPDGRRFADTLVTDVRTAQALIRFAESGG